MRRIKDTILKDLCGQSLPIASFIIAPLLHLFLFGHFLPDNLHGHSTLLTGTFYLVLQTWYFSFALNRATLSKFIPDLVDFIYLLFLGTIAVSVIIYGYNQWLKYVPFFMIAPYAAGRLFNYHEFGKFFKVLYVLVLISAFVVTIEIADTFGGEPPRGNILLFGYNHGGGIASNLLGMLVVVVVARLVSIYDNKRYVIANGIIILPWLLTVIIDLRFRSALYSALLVSGGLIILSKEKIKKRLSVAVYLLITIFSVGRLSGYNSISFLIAPITESFSSWDDISWSNTSSVVQRKVLYSIAIKEFFANPFAGIGAGRFYLAANIQGAYPHNSVLQALAEIGAIGGLLYLAIVILICYRLIGIIKKHWADSIGKWSWLLLGLWTYTFGIEFVSGNYFTSAVFWLLTGLAVTIVKSKNNWLYELKYKN